MSEPYSEERRKRKQAEETERAKTWRWEIYETKKSSIRQSGSRKSLRTEAGEECYHSRPTLCDPLSVGFSRQEYWSGLPCPPPRDLPGPGIGPTSPVAPALKADSLPLSHQGSLRSGRQK